MFEENERRGVSGQARQDVGRVLGKRAGAGSALGFAADGAAAEVGEVPDKRAESRQCIGKLFKVF